MKLNDLFSRSNNDVDFYEVPLDNEDSEISSKQK